jgi:hypothetical protein
VDVISPLWELMTVIVRPADSVNTYHDLSQLMKYLRDQRKLVQSRMADRNQKHWPQGTIVLGEGWHQVGYMPAMERNHKIPLAEAGWPYVLAAEGRAKEWAGQRKDQLEDLKSQADVISLEDVEGGKQGQVFLKTGPNSGALAAVKKDGRGLGVRIVRTIGMRARPGGWMRGDAPQADWPDSDLFFAFEAWKKKP